MGNIHVSRAGASLGVFAEEEVREGLRTGRFLSSDLGWREGMTEWQPLTTFAEFAGANPAVPSTPGPASSLPPIADIAHGVAAISRSGLPWEHRAALGVVNAFFETLKMVLLQSSAAFSTMKTEGGMGEPILYALIGAGFGALFYFLLTFVFHIFGTIASDRNPLVVMFGAGLGMIFGIVLIPVVLICGIFLGAGLLHLSLMLIGGAKRSFETTFRVVCFAVGSTYPLLIVPVCGGLICGIWAIVAECIGIARAHQIETSRAALAVFLPLVLCCGGGLIFGVMFGALGAIFGHH